MEQFCNLVMSDFKTSRDVTYYAKRLFITPKYLSMILKEMGFSHLSVKEWIDGSTITEIKMILKSTSSTLQDITTELQFPNLSFLCKYFKTRTGMIPKEYRGQSL
jgi:YesN/AraC family two-component response regulator